MNWNGGSLARHARGRKWNKEDATRQKEHFANARVRHLRQHSSSAPLAASKFIPSYLQKEPVEAQSSVSPGPILHRLRSKGFPAKIRPPTEPNSPSLPRLESPSDLEVRRRNLLKEKNWAGIGQQESPALGPGWRSSSSNLSSHLDREYPPTLGWFWGSHRPRLAGGHDNDPILRHKPQAGRLPLTTRGRKLCPQSNILPSARRKRKRDTLDLPLISTDSDRQHRLGPEQKRNLFSASEPKSCQRRDHVKVQVGSQVFHWGRFENSVRGRVHSCHSLSLHKPSTISTASYENSTPGKELSSFLLAAAPSRSRAPNSGTQTQPRFDVCQYKDRLSTSPASLGSTCGSQTAKSRIQKHNLRLSDTPATIAMSSPTLIKHPRPTRSYWRVPFLDSHLSDQESAMAASAKSMHTSRGIDLQISGFDDQGPSGRHIGVNGFSSAVDGLQNQQGSRLHHLSTPPGVGRFSQLSHSSCNSTFCRRGVGDGSESHLPECNNPVRSVEAHAEKSVSKESATMIQPYSPPSADSAESTCRELTNGNEAHCSFMSLLSPLPAESERPPSKGDSKIVKLGSMSSNTDNEEEIWKNFVFDSDVSELSQLAHETACKQTKNQLVSQLEQIAASDTAEPPSELRSNVEIPSAPTPPSRITKEFKVIQQDDIGNLQVEGSALTWESSDCSLLVREEEALQTNRFCYPRPFVGRLATTCRAEDHNPALAAREGQRKRRKCRDKDRPDIRALPNFEGDPIESP